RPSAPRLPGWPKSSSPVRSSRMGWTTPPRNACRAGARLPPLSPRAVSETRTIPMSKSDAQLVVTFRADKVKNEAKSVEAGRPIYDDIELCEVRTAGDRETVKVFPAHAFHQWAMNEEGEQEQITYAQRWSEQYRRFKERRAQIQEGTPLSELPFLT